jgi:hypothetical protein
MTMLPANSKSAPAVGKKKGHQYSLFRPVPGKNRTTPKKQQNLIGIVTSIVKRAGNPLSVATIRSILDESGEYEFKKGVEGWRKTNQITSAIYNHIAKYGESALLQKIDGGYSAREGGVA